TGPSGIDETFAAQLTWPGDVLVQFDCGFRAPYRAEMEFVGEEGTLLAPGPFRPDPEIHLRLVRGGETELVEVPGPDRYLLEVEDLGEAVRQGRAPRVSLADSRANVAAITALYESAREGRPVRLAG